MNLPSEEYISQRVIIYSLLSAEGSFISQHVSHCNYAYGLSMRLVTCSNFVLQALSESYMSETITEAERNSLILAFASVPNPSQEFVQWLEEMVGLGSETTNLILVYGALVGNAAPDMEMGMVTFLTNRIPEDTVNNQEVLIHIIHALGNTKSPQAVQYIIQYMEHGNEDVRLAVITALRFFSHMTSVQQLLLRTLLNDPSEALVSVVIDALSDGHDITGETAINEDLILVLTKLIISFDNRDLQKELIHYLKLVDTAETLTLAHALENNDYKSLQKRDTYYWNSTNPIFDIISSSGSRLSDITIPFQLTIAFCGVKQLGKPMAVSHSI